MTFDPALHEYSENGHIIPGVTTILKEAGWIDDQWFTEEAREKGSAVHVLCQRYANGSRLDGAGRELAGLEYVNAFAAWIAVTHAYPIALECKVSGMLNGHRYAGTFDGLYEIRGKRILIDLKTGARAKWHPIQLAAYSLAFMESGERVNPDQCIDLYLAQDGKYREEKIPGKTLLWGIEQFKNALA